MIMLTSSTMIMGIGITMMIMLTSITMIMLTGITIIARFTNYLTCNHTLDQTIRHRPCHSLTIILIAIMVSFIIWYTRISVICSIKFLLQMAMVLVFRWATNARIYKVK